MIIDAQENDVELQKKVQMVREGDKTFFFQQKKMEVCISITDYMCHMIKS